MKIVAVAAPVVVSWNCHADGRDVGSIRVDAQRGDTAGVIGTSGQLDAGGGFPFVVRSTPVVPPLRNPVATTAWPLPGQAIPGDEAVAGGVRPVS